MDDPSLPSTAPPIIHELVAKFTEHRDTYKRGDYNETQLRRDFLDPFFAAMGWDIDNRKGYAEKFREVIHEDALRVEASVKAPDYCFRIGGQRIFFVEAKKPAVNIKDDTAPAFQLRRYAWTAKMPLSILTDFEELAVYDCRIKPDKNDKASTGRVMLLKYTDYAQRWQELCDIFSYEAIARGAFDKYAESNKKKRGTAEVDEAFLAEIEEWRESLAKNLSLRNKDLTDRELNTAVQLIIDRIIFLRMCEGRGIEKFARLQGIANGTGVYPRLVELFRRADEKYNSGLFHFTKEAGRDDPDVLTTELTVDDKVLKEIIRRLYYPESPYEFAAMPAEILGQVYEQFLGKVIRLTKGHQAKIEEKPEVRKAGGVYYTPKYIVDYIVENTVGKLLEGKTPQEVGGLTEKWKPSKTGRPLTVLDPACGSGSFLIVAYQYLLDWYLKQYTDVDKPEKHARGAEPRIYLRKANDWRLTTSERKRILLSHIYGVDIDYQAVEVTKLSLLLKVLEGETEETLQRQLFAKERALPDLANNIKCGNSLIGPDFYTGRQGELFDEEEALRINAFDWQSEFKEIFSGKNPGFDVVIGNPPWGAEFKKHELEYLRKKHERVIARMIDSYIYFVDKAVTIGHDSCPVGFIIPSTLLNQVDAQPLRELLLARGIANLVSVGAGVFGPKVLNTSTIFVSNPMKKDQILLSDLSRTEAKLKALELQETQPIIRKTWERAVLDNPDKTFLVTGLANSQTIKRVRSRCGTFRNVLIGEIQRGVSPDVVAAHVLTPSEADELQIERPLLRRSISGRQIKRYYPCVSDQVLIYTSRGDDISNYPNALAHLSKFRKLNTCKEVLQGKHPWWALHRPRNPEIFSAPKFIGLTTTKKIEVVLDSTAGLYVTDAMYVFQVITEIDPRYCLGVLHSRAFLFFYRVANQGESRIIPQIKASKLYDLPFPVSPSRPLSDKLISAVDEMMKLVSKEKAKTSHEIAHVSRRIAATDREIDQLVYQLYGLTDKEIALVEEATESR